MIVKQEMNVCDISCNKYSLTDKNIKTAKEHKMACSNFFQGMKTEFLKDFSKSFLSTNENNYFLAVGRTIPWSRDDFSEVLNFDEYFYLPFQGGFGLSGNDSTIPTVDETQKSKSSYRIGNLFMKRLKEDDFSFMVPKYIWEKGTIYDVYDDTQNLFNPRKKFFVYNKQDNAIYKCLENGGGASSTVEPEESYTEGSFLLEDGYRWKLIYKIDDSQRVKFSIESNSDLGESYVPIKIIDFNYNLNKVEQMQYDIQTSAIPGSIESVAINSEFKNHITFDPQKCIVDQDNACAVYSNGSSGFNVVEVVACGNLTSHPYAGNNVWTNYLKNFVFNVVSGVGSGQRRIISRSQIIDHSTNNPYLKLELESPLNYGISGFSGSTPKSFFTIEPQIKVFGDGTSLTGENSVGNSALIEADFKPRFKETQGETTKTLNVIEVINPGKDYTRIRAEFVSGITHHYPSFSGNALSDKITSFNTNTKNFLRPILPPEGGHGSNPLQELGGDKILFKINLESDESGTFNTESDFRQISLIKNPILNDPIVQLRFVETGTNQLTVGNVVSYAGVSGSGVSTGTINKVFNFSDDSGNEIIVGGIEGSFDGATSVYISQSGGAGGATFTIDPFDGFRKYVIAGSENRSNIILEVETTESNTYFPRDIIVGLGSSENSTYSSFASGMIREVKAVANKRIFTLEDVQGTFKIGEKIGVVNKPKNDGNSIFRILNNSKVLSYRRSRKNYKDSYSVTTKITLNAAGGNNFTNNSFYQNQPIYSFEDTNYSSEQLKEKVVASGHLTSWEVKESGAKVVLEVIGTKKGSFQVGNYIPYLYNSSNVIIYGEIFSVKEADIKYDSGEIVYIQNFKPIQRSDSTKEELGLVLGL